MKFATSMASKVFGSALVRSLVVFYAAYAVAGLVAQWLREEVHPLLPNVLGLALAAYLLYWAVRYLISLIRVHRARNRYVEALMALDWLQNQ